MAPCRRFPGGRLCPNGKRRRTNEIAARSLASPELCHAYSRSASFLGRLTAHSCRRRHGSQSIHIGAHIHFVPIAWRARLLRVAERPAAGIGGSATTARDGLPATFRTPPAPFRERAYARGPGFCCVCGQPVYRFGWHVDLWDTGTNKNAVWHCACVVAWQFWTAPSDHARLLRRLQARRCGESGGRLWKSAEVDHRVPLFRVWSELPGRAVAGAARLLGLAKPSGDQSRCPCRKMRDRGAAPTRRAQSCVRTRLIA